MQLSKAIEQATKEEFLASIHAYYQGSQDPAWGPVLEEKIGEMSLEKLQSLELELLREAGNRDGLSVFMGMRKPGSPGLVQEMLRALLPNHVFESISTL
jgi:hypothetical protein